MGNRVRDSRALQGSQAGALARLAALSASGETPMTRMESLLGATRLWWDCCAEAARDRPEWLQRSHAALAEAIAGDDDHPQAPEVPQGKGTAPDIADAVGLFDDPVMDRSRGELRRETLLRAARATTAVALSLANGEDSSPERNTLLMEAIAYWRSTRALPDVPATSSAMPQVPRRAPAGVRQIAKVLDQVPDRGLAASMTAVQALLLSGVTPSKLHRQRIGILLDASELGPSPGRPSAARTVLGKRGTLTVSVLRHGPPGLFPDPRAMGFFEGDEEFAAALKEAWAHATRRRRARCLLWSLTEPDRKEPFLRITGPSLGAAFAIAISDALKRIPLPSLRKIRTEYAVTGEVQGDGRLLEVSGIPAKAEALRDRNEFLIIAPEANEEKTDTQHLPDSVSFEWASTIREARRFTRRFSRIRMAISMAAACVVALVASVVVNEISTSHAREQLQASVTAQLDATANQVNNSNPPLAMLLALQANAAGPSDRTRSGLLSTLIADSGLVRTLHGHARKVLDAGISTVGGTPFAVTGGFDGDLRVWDLRTGKCTEVISGPENGVIDTIAFDPVLPSLVLTAGVNGASLWTLTPGGRLTGARYLQGPEAGRGILSAAFSSDGLNLVLGYEDGIVRVINPANGSVTASVQPARNTSQLQEPITAVAYGQSDSIVYAGDANDSSGGSGAGNVYRIEVARRASRVGLLRSGQHGSVNSISYVKHTFGPAVLLIGTTEGLLAWDPVAGRQAEPFPLAGISDDVASIKSNAQISAIGTTSGISIIQNAGLTTSRQPIPGVDGIGLDSSSGYLLTVAPGGDAYEWDLNNQPLVTGYAPYDGATAVEYASDGRLITVDRSGELGQYPERIPAADPQGPSPIVDADTGAAQTLAVQQIDGQQVAVLGDWSDIHSRAVLINVDSKRIIRAPGIEAFARRCYGIRAAAFSPDGRRLVIACYFSGQVTSWDTRTWREVASANLAYERVQSLAVTTDGSTVVAGTGPNPIGDDNSPQALWFLRLNGLQAIAQPVATHPGGVSDITSGDHLIYSAGWDGTIRSWTLTGHPTGQSATVDGKVFALAYDRQENLLIAATSDGLSLYDPTSLQPLSPPMKVGDPNDGPQAVMRLAISPDGKYLAGALSNSSGPTGVDEWDMTEADWTSQICDKAGRNLTPAEWARYGSPGVEPISVCPDNNSPGPSLAPGSPNVNSVSGLSVISAKAIPMRHVTCADLDGSATVRCGLFGAGYAWTIGQDSMGRTKVTIYADRGTSWQPLLATSRHVQAEEAAAVPFTTQRGEPALAVWQVVSGDGSVEELSIVQDGRILYDQKGSIEAVEPQQDGLKIWSGVYQPFDSVCCPSGHTSELLVREQDGEWSIKDQQAVPATAIPRM